MNGYGDNGNCHGYRIINGRKKISRRRRAMIMARRRALVLFSSLAMVLCLFFSARSISNAKSADNAPQYKYFKSVQVEVGDSLYSIAEENVDFGYYKSVQAYIDEVCMINHISDEDHIICGSTLFVPYYSEDVK